MTELHLLSVTREWFLFKAWKADFIQSQIIYLLQTYHVSSIMCEFSGKMSMWDMATHITWEHYQSVNSYSWQPNESKIFFSPFCLSSGGFCCFVACPLCSCILAAGFSEQTLLYPVLPYKPLSFFSELWEGRARRSGYSTCFCVSNAFSVPLEKLSRSSTLCYLGMKCRLMPSCECCIL